MQRLSPRERRCRAVLALGLPLAAVAVVSACGSGGGAGAGSASHTAASAGTTIGVHTGADGTYLTGASGRTVYLWAADTSGKSTCSGACATAWPPVTTTGAPRASGSATAADLGTTTRSDGMRQVTYDGHPLYYFAGDTGPGDTDGQGSDAFGATWWLVAPSGSAITGSGTATSSAPARGGYY